MNLQIQETQQTPSRTNSETQDRHILINLSKVKDKEKNLGNSKQFVTFKNSVRSTAIFSSKSMEAKRQWNDLFTLLKKNSDK
jgi:hypothetical protein